MHGEAEHITNMARTWGKDDLADLAFIALSRTCLDARVGSQIRQALYEWSRATSTPQTLKLTIVRVCEPLGQTYPSIALTRLKHLATHSNSQVATEVIKVARALAGQGHRQEVLGAALDWCAKSNRENLSDRARRRRRKVGAMLFLELAATITPLELPDTPASRHPTPRPSCQDGGPSSTSMANPAYGVRRSSRSCAGGWTKPSAIPICVHELRRLRRRGSTALVLRWSELDRPGEPDQANAKLMIDVAQRWAATDPTDIIRAGIKDQIVIPLTYPWWLRLLKVIYAKLRTRLITSLRGRE